MNFETPLSTADEPRMEQPAHFSKPSQLSPVPTVRVLSPNGVEYVFMTIALVGAASAFAGILLLLVNANFSFDSLAFPTAVLIVLLPVFAALFLRLKKRELRDPGLRFDPSKRRSTQFIQIAAFAVCLLTLIGFVFAVLSKLGGSFESSIIKIFFDALCILFVAGGILAYYWRDEHKADR
ncbi:MAG TPA: hypothetical protein VLH38_01920 [Patescibacteria group bacterium]|nr:hypothetical protein [Patescibacteria group bacterium]